MSTTTFIALPQLDRLQIASPCSARWEEMTGSGGDDRSRLCGQCNHKVHNISGMTRPEAEAFLANSLVTDGSSSSGRVCMRFYRRADGTILTADCPVGLAALRVKARRAAARFAAAIGLTSLVAWAAAGESRSAPFAYSQPLASIAAWLREPTASPTPAMMGKVSYMGRVSIMPAPLPPPAMTSSTQPGAGQ